MRRDAHGSAGGQAIGCPHRTMNGSGRKRTGAATTLGLALALLGHSALAQASDPFPLPRTTYGSIGMIEMPSARMAPDGELSLSASFARNLQRYNFGFQALPYLEFNFRYSILHAIPLDPSNSQYYDRSFGLGLRLFKEGEYRPAIVLGIRDLVGTGVYSAEYLVATKRIFDNFDLTFGLGWGRLSSAGAALPNPFGYLSQSFKTRPEFGIAGSFSLKSFFHGPHVAPFGGVVWRTPIRNLSLTAEYSSDGYKLESQYGTFTPKYQVNFGAQYQLSNSIQIGAEWLYGESAGLTLTFTGNPTRPTYKSTFAPRPIPRSIRSPEQQLQAIKELMKPLQAAEQKKQQSSAKSSTDLASFTTAVYRDRVRDVTIKGTTLVASMAGHIARAKCLAYARVAAENLIDIDSVVIRSNSGKVVACTLPTDAANRTDARSRIKIAPVFVTDATGAPLELPVKPYKRSRTAIREDASKQLLFVDTVGIGNGVATVYYENGTYGSAADAAGRLIRVLMKDTPPNVEEFHMISMVDGLPAQEYNVLRSPMERAIEQDGGVAEIRQAVRLREPPMRPPLLEEADSQPYPRFIWSLSPSLRESFFNPQNPLRAGLFATLGGEFRLTPQLAISASTDASIWNNLVSGRKDNSILPHVRSDFEKYYKYGADGISSLMLSYRWRVAPDVTAIVKGGYLESMFGGFGGEVLWHPERSRFAVGVDLYQVWQRNYDRLFGFQNYHVLTGHVSLYYQSPWHHIGLKFMYGRYLAKDHGFTLEMFRRFSTGVEIGAFMTLTNVSAAQFGEGSFDKGIIIRIPFDWLLPIPTQSAYSIDLRPLTRDGGQRLASDTVLYDTLQRESYGSVAQHWGELGHP
ncbi:MAG: YjbH domain-containing protein [Rhizomicrobium sp.]